MTDLPIIIAFSLLVIFATMFAEREAKHKLELNDCAQTNALIWEEGMATTDLLKQCKKRKKK